MDEMFSWSKCRISRISRLHSAHARRGVSSTAVSHARDACCTRTTGCPHRMRSASVRSLKALGTFLIATFLPVLVSSADLQA